MNKALAVVFAAGALALAACGGGSSSKSSSASTTPSYSGSADSQFCQLGAQVGDGFANIGGTLSGDAASIKSALGNLKSLADEAKDAAPSSIKSDVNTLADTFDRFYSSAQDAGFDPQRVSGLAQQAFSSAGAGTALQHLQAYGEQVCGLGSATSTP